MTNVDQFESVFRSASKEVFSYDRPRVKRVLVLTDLPDEQAYAFGEGLKDFLKVLGEQDEATDWDIVRGDEFDSIESMLTVIEKRQPDLIITYRHLRNQHWDSPYTLGDYLVVITQETPTPTLVVPHPNCKRISAHALRDTNSIMAITSNLTGDHVLINWAARMTQTNGTLFLTHIEDNAVFNRYMEVISKIPAIDTETARQTIAEQLLKEPTDFIHSCRQVLIEKNVSVNVKDVVRMGHRLHEYKSLIEEFKIDMLVFNTKDDDQLAMHGLAYPLAVELREVPLLML